MLMAKSSAEKADSGCASITLRANDDGFSGRSESVDRVLPERIGSSRPRGNDRFRENDHACVGGDRLA
jgi:hypothetical protein